MKHICTEGIYNIYFTCVGGLARSAYSVRVLRCLCGTHAARVHDGAGWRRTVVTERSLQEATEGRIRVPQRVGCGGCLTNVSVYPSRGSTHKVLSRA